jgi:HPt (histidine-containing phosphotransfer) domain-containing protein
LTANAMAQDREDCLNAGMDDHLSKPFNTLALQNTLDRWMPRSAAPQAEAAQLAAQATAKAAAVLDRPVLDELGKMLTNGKPELLTRVINVYLVESPKLMHRLKQAALANDAPEIARAAHSLKSGSANVGAMVLSRYCAEVEVLARRAETEQARKILANIETEHGCVQAALTAEFESLVASKA